MNRALSTQQRHRRVRHTENPVTGVIIDHLRLGCRTPVAWRNGLEPGIEIGVSLLAKSIHIMPGK